MAFVIAGIRTRLGAVWRLHVDLTLVYRMKLLAWVKTIINPTILYRDLGENELRVLALQPALTGRVNEPVRCALLHVSLDHAPEYRAWKQQADPKIHPYKKTRAWELSREKLADGDRVWDRYCRYVWGDYLALSYAWGSDARDYRIILDGRLVSVTKNLESALRSSRACLVDENSLIRLWVDALCINQDNREERGREVRRMQRIYGDAYATLIHLGERSDDSDMALETINALGPAIEDGSLSANWLRAIARDIYLGKPNPMQEPVIAIFKLLCRPYWSRTWIIQELLMGSLTNKMVCCGGRAASLEDIRRVLEMIVYNIESLIIITGSQLYGENVGCFEVVVGLLLRLGRVRRLLLLPEYKESVVYRDYLLPILTLAQAATATDYRDKVYGLLGVFPTKLVSEIDRADQNYEVSASEVFIRLSKAVIELSGELDMIFAGSAFQGSLSQMSLPTWVVDWTVKRERSLGMDDKLTEWFLNSEESDTTAMTDLTQPDLSRKTVENSLPRSDNGRAAHIRFSEDARLLFCEGFSIGTINGISAEVIGLTAVSKAPDSVVQSQNASNPYRDPLEVSDALFRTLMLHPLANNSFGLFNFPWFGAEADLDAYSGSACHTETMLEFIDKMQEKGWDSDQFVGRGFELFEAARRRFGMFAVGGRPFKDYFSTDIPDCPTDFDFTCFLTIVNNVYARRLVTLCTGHVGLAPASVVSGDSIYILLGSSMPVVLRFDNERGHYIVVCECYIDGFMKGEAMEGLDSKKYQLQNFSLS